MHQSIKDRVGECWVGELTVPEFDWQLTGDDEAAALVSIFDEFKQQRLVVLTHWNEAKIIQNEEWDFAHIF